MSVLVDIAQRGVNYIWGQRQKNSSARVGKSHQQRNFKSAEISHLTGNWSTSIVSIDTVVDKDHRKLKARSRYQFNNNDYMRRFVGILSCNVVGSTGVMLQAMSKDNGELDHVANAAIEKAWGEWGQRSVCDMAGRYSWLMHQTMFIKTIAVDGEYLARKIYHQNEFGFALQVIDTELLDVMFNHKFTDGRFIRHAIEFNEYSKPIAYHILRVDGSQGSADFVKNGKRYQRISADEIIHEFLPQQVGQKRGFPMASTAMLRLQMLSGYEESALKAARLGASQMGFFKTQEGASVEPMGQTDENGNPIQDEQGNFISEVEPGTFEVLPEGYDLAKFDPDYPHSQFGEFIKACLRGIASGLGVSYNTLANDLEGVNFSSIRQGVLEDREVWKVLQAWMIDVFNKPIFDDWLRYALLNQQITTERGKPLRLSLIDKYREVRWQPRRWQWVDPLKDASTAKMEEEQGWTSKSDIIRGKGGDPVEVAKERERDKELFKETVSDNKESGQAPDSSFKGDEKSKGKDDDD